MSYCRFSSDNWKSDVYVFEHVDGWFQIHVATNKKVGEIEPPWPEPHGDEDYFKKHEAHLEAVRSAPMEKIDHELAGASFEEKTREDTVAKLRKLQAEGFRVPKKVFEILEEEIRQSQKR